MNKSCSTFLVRGLLLLLVALPLFCLAVGVVIALQNFEVGCDVDFVLYAEDEFRVEIHGYDPKIVAEAAGAIPWISGVFGRNVDLAMLMAIYLKETAGGTTYGGYVFTPSTESPAGWLLNHFKNYRIRSSNPVAGQYITADYCTYTGHRQGEMGPGFWPPTGKTICQKYLANDRLREVSSCDYWNGRVFFRAIGAVITAPPYKYDSSMTPEEKVTALRGWNWDLQYRRSLVKLASDINRQIGSIRAVGIEGGSQSYEIAYGRGPLHDLASLALKLILEPFGLIPKAEIWLDAPLPQEYPRVITSDYLEERETEDGRTLIHWGVDWDCQIGDPIVALASGKVIKPSPGTLMSLITGFGTHVWINHQGWYVVYAHLDEALVSEGDVVKQGEVIGLCGNTGNVYPEPSPENPEAGSHIHVGVADQPPDEFEIYGETEPGWISPHLVCGQCVPAIR